MLVFKIVLIGIAGAILVMITKQFKPEYSIPVLLGICLFPVSYTHLVEIMHRVRLLKVRLMRLMRERISSFAFLEIRIRLRQSFISIPIIRNRLRLRIRRRRLAVM